MIVKLPQYLCGWTGGAGRCSCDPAGLLGGRYALPWPGL